MNELNHYREEDFPKNLTVNIGAKYSFKNYKQISKWFEKEELFWNELDDSKNFSSNFRRDVKNEIEIRFSTYRREYFTITDLLEEWKNIIESAYKKNGLIFSKSKEGRWLQQIKKNNPILLEGAIDYFSGKIKGKQDETIGQIAAYLFDNKIEPDFDLEKKKYQDFYTEIVEQKDDLLAELIAIKEENNALTLLYQEQKEQWENRFLEQETIIGKRFDDEFIRHQSQMQENEDFYVKELAVKKAVTYWSEKAKSHKKNAIGFGVSAAILMIASIVTIIYIGNNILNLDLNDKRGTANRILTDSGALQIWVYGLFIVSITITAWSIKLLVKVFLSNLHLLSDARERETMIMTYLAFEREEKVLNKEDKNLILPSIFRVSSNGIIKDDTTPNTPLNIVMKKFE